MFKLDDKSVKWSERIPAEAKSCLVPRYGGHDPCQTIFSTLKHCLSLFLNLFNWSHIHNDVNSMFLRIFSFASYLRTNYFRTRGQQKMMSTTKVLVICFVEIFKEVLVKSFWYLKNQAWSFSPISKETASSNYYLIFLWAGSVEEDAGASQNDS